MTRSAGKIATVITKVWVCAHTHKYSFLFRQPGNVYFSVSPYNDIMTPIRSDMGQNASFKGMDRYKSSR